MYIDMAKIGMDKNIFQFNGKFYRQNEGAAMGNSLSGFLAEIFMRYFEMDLKDHPLFHEFGSVMWTTFFRFVSKEKLIRH